MTKSRTKNSDQQKLLTETELELMGILWKMGEGTVTEVMKGLPPERQLAYTSVSTILRILEQKEVLTTRKEGREHVYIPNVSKTDYEAKAVNHLVKRVFDNTPVALVKQLLDSVPLDANELEELRALVKSAGRKK